MKTDIVVTYLIAGGLLLSSFAIAQPLPLLRKNPTRADHEDDRDSSTHLSDNEMRLVAEMFERLPKSNHNNNDDAHSKKPLNNKDLLSTRRQQQQQQQRRRRRHLKGKSKTLSPTSSPTTSQPTTSSPSPAPTDVPTTSQPTGIPTTTPTSQPTGFPTTTPTSQPTRQPTGLPTNQPTTSQPTQMPTGCSAGLSFEMIDLSMDNVTELFPVAVDDAVELVELPFDFNWVGQQIIPKGTGIGVTTNGQLNMDNYLNPNCCTVDPIYGLNNGTSYGRPRVAFVQSDLYVYPGQVLLRSLPQSLLISFQGAVFYSSSSSPFNAQVELFASGTITICYGSNGPNRKFAAGVEDHLLNVIAPVTDTAFGFGPNGVNNGEQWPAGFCWCYIP